LVGPESFMNGKPGRLTQVQKDTIDGVIKHYGFMTAQQLSDLNHSEQPWIDARAGLPPLSRCQNEITPSAMMLYYSGLIDDTLPF